MESHPAPYADQPSPPSQRSRLEDILDQCPIEVLHAVLFLLRTRPVQVPIP